MSGKFQLQDENGTTVDFTPTSAQLTGANQVVSSKPIAYMGFTIRETTGTTAAVVRIWDNASAASGTVLDEIALSGGQSAREFYPMGGVRAYNGVYVQVVSGAVTGSVRVG